MKTVEHPVGSNYMNLCHQSVQVDGMDAPRRPGLDLNHADMFLPRFVALLPGSYYVLNVTEREAAIVNKGLKQCWNDHGRFKSTSYRSHYYTVKIKGGDAFKQEDVDGARSIPSLARYLNL